jgi:rhodanese-related sulfurtransferase
VQLFLDPQREQEAILFVDARDDRHFEEGHIPGAYQLDRYYPEKHLPVVLPACLRAVKVVVYCAGGTCEDSEFAALSLIEAGVPRDRIFVFSEGMAGWIAQNRPLEIGVRNSGLLRAAAP